MVENFSSPNKIWQTKSRGVNITSSMNRINEKCVFSLGNPGEMRQPEIPMRRYYDNIKLDLKGIGYEVVE
jgi:hypothetical protein